MAFDSLWKGGSFYAGSDNAGEDNRKAGPYGFKSNLGVSQSLKFWISHQTASPPEQECRLS